MGFTIDENKVKPELISDERGIKLYRYNQPLYLYFTNNDNDSFYIQKTRTPRGKNVVRVCKASCFYRACISDYVIKELEKVHCVTVWSPTMIVVNDKKRFRWQVEGLTGVKFDHITYLRGYYNMSFDNSDLPKANLIDEVMFFEKDIKEVTTFSKKEKEQLQERTKYTLLEQLFGKRIESIAEENSMFKATWSSDKTCVYLSDKMIQKLIDDHLEKVMGEFNNLGLKTTLYDKRSYKVKLKLPMIKIELSDDLTTTEGECQ